MAGEKSADNVAFGAAMRSEREACGYSVEAFARRVALGTGEVEAIERGEGNVTYLMVLKIADGLGMGAAELVMRAGL
jgi:XRE family transcriptional regulator, regulator of sulfur utilization